MNRANRLSPKSSRTQSRAQPTPTTPAKTPSQSIRDKPLKPTKPQPSQGQPSPIDSVLLELDRILKSDPKPQPQVMISMQDEPVDQGRNRKPSSLKVFRVAQIIGSKFSAARVIAEGIQAQPMPPPDKLTEDDLREFLLRGAEIDEMERRQAHHQTSSEPLETQLNAVQDDLNGLILQNDPRFEYLEHRARFAEQVCREYHYPLDNKTDKERLDLEILSKETSQAQVFFLQEILAQETQAKEALEAQVHDLQRRLQVETDERKAFESYNEACSKKLDEEQLKVSSLQESLGQETEAKTALQNSLDEANNEIRVLKKVIDVKDCDFGQKIQKLQESLDSEADVKNEMARKMEAVNLDLEAVKAEKAELADDVTKKAARIEELVEIINKMHAGKR